MASRILGVVAPIYKIRQIGSEKLFIILMVFIVICIEAIMERVLNTCDGVTAVILVILRETILGAGVVRLEHRQILTIVFHDLQSFT